MMTMMKIIVSISIMVTPHLSQSRLRPKDARCCTFIKDEVVSKPKIIVVQIDETKGERHREIDTEKGGDLPEVMQRVTGRAGNKTQVC